MNKYIEIDNIFTEMKENIDSEGKLKINCKELSKEIGKIFNIKRDIKVNVKESKDNFFGMMIIPLDIFAYNERLLNKDSSVPNLCDTGFSIIIQKEILKVFDPKELTAILLHEIGHLVLTNEIGIQIKHLLFTECVALGILFAPIVMGLDMCVLLTLPISILFSNASHIIIQNHDEEQHADRFAIKEGYGEELKSAFDKIKYKFIFDSKSKIKELESQNNIIVKGSLMNIINFEHRKMLIRKNVDELTKDNVYKRTSLMDNLIRVKKYIDIKSGELKDKEKVNLLSEGIFFKTKINFDSINQVVDFEKKLMNLQILVESELKDSNDKLEYMETAYDYLKQCKLAVKKTKNDEIKKRINDYIELLYNIIAQIRDKEIPLTRFGVIINPE